MALFDLPMDSKLRGCNLVGLQIYRFRGAAIATYQSGRDKIARADPDAVIVLTASFRSDPSILDHVNGCW